MARCACIQAIRHHPHTVYHVSTLKVNIRPEWMELNGMEGSLVFAAVITFTACVLK